MAESLLEKKKKMECMQLELNILRLETRSMELDEEKQKVQENIEAQKIKLQELKKIE